MVGFQTSTQSCRNCKDFFSSDVTCLKFILQLKKRLEKQQEKVKQNLLSRSRLKTKPFLLSLIHFTHSHLSVSGHGHMWQNGAVSDSHETRLRYTQITYFVEPLS